MHCVSQFICQMHSVKHLSYHVQLALRKMWVVKYFFPWWKLSQSQWCNPNWELLKNVYLRCHADFSVFLGIHSDSKNVLLSGCFLTGVTSLSAAPIEGALPILIWRILTPGYDPLHMIGGSQRYSSTSRYFVSHQVHGNKHRGRWDSNLSFGVLKPNR